MASLGLGFVSARVLGLLLGYGCLWLSVVGSFRDTPSAEAVFTLLAVLGLLGAGVFQLQRLEPTSKRYHVHRQFRDVELGTLAIAAAASVIEWTGGAEGGFYPFMYLLLVGATFLGKTFNHRLYFLALIIVTDGATLYAQQPVGFSSIWLIHTGFAMGTMALCIWLQHPHRTANSVEQQLNAIHTDARDFRLTSSLSFGDRNLRVEDLHKRRNIGSVKAIRESLYHVLAVAEHALSPYTVALFWLDSSDQHLQLKELRSQSDEVMEQPIRAGVGLLGAVLKKGESIILNNLRANHTGLVYYRKPPVIRHFAAVPIREGEFVRGVLVADRMGENAQPFSSIDLQTLETIASESMRAVQVEQVFNDMDRDKFQRERFYNASRSFNRALSVEDVCKVALDTIDEVCGLPFAAVAIVDTEDRSQLVVEAVRGKSANTDLYGHRFKGEGTLVGAALKAKHSLPHGTVHASNQSIFGNGAFHFENVKVIPLLWKNRGTGALILGSDTANFVGYDVVDMFEVIADHAAIAIENALMYEHMQRMATTDGLTRLTNHRHFQELFDGQLARAERYGRHLSMVLVDIDHFKTVNDTYGHPVGDAVLKQVAKLLEDNARVTDVAARYGGEEFVVLLDETDRQGARIIADRIREGMAALEFRSEKGKFSRTMSLGVATYPEDGTRKADLIERADKALYQAKESGRNRVVCYDEVTARGRR